MCGIAGFVNLRPGGMSEESSRVSLRRATDKLLHRGPEGGGLGLIMR